MVQVLLPRPKHLIAWLLVIPTIAWFYIGLFLTMGLWYPAGVSLESWQSHVFHFTVVYALWLLVFFSYRMFEWDVLRTTRSFLKRLIIVLLICLAIAAIYFYFQPSLLITPRRFLLVHLLITGLGVMAWYILMHRAALRGSRRSVFIHSSAEVLADEIQSVIKDHNLLGLEYNGVIKLQEPMNFSSNAIVVMPARSQIDPSEIQSLFALRNQGVKFVEYHVLYETLTRTIELSALNDLWFIDSVDYSSHQIFDALKRVSDIIFGLVGIVMFAVSFPFVAPLVKFSTGGSVFFKQDRVGQLGQVFTLYKYRTMSAGGVNNTWTQSRDQRITKVGNWLRRLRLDELPQFINILKGEMSLVGPRPEQVHIVEELRQQIPYYDERHIVKPGLTGWAQLHVYAASVEETKRKLQYDLYYIKHRSLLFDAEIILKTIYNILSFSGR